MRRPVRTPDPHQRWLTFVHSHAKVIMACIRDHGNGTRRILHHNVAASAERGGTACADISECLAFLSPVIARTFPFDEIVEAHRFMEAGNQVGKIVVTI